MVSANRREQERENTITSIHLRSQQTDASDVVRSPKLPGGDFVSALLNRQVMGLADRGGASGLIGQRWADLSSNIAASLADGGERRGCRYTRLVRLDDIPSVASTAAKRGLQNPDLLLFGEHDGKPFIQGADAKFSIETARVKQVSPEVVEALLGIGPVIDQVLGGADRPAEIEPGFFICPDYPLTRAMLNGRHGILKTTVRLDDVLLAPVSGGEFFDGVESAGLMAPLARVDRLGVDLSASLLAGLYYFRLARAGVGCWLDAVKPLLTFNDVVAVDLDAVMAGLEARSGAAPSAFNLILRWNDEVEAIRAQRAEVDRVTGLPIMTKDLRALTVTAMKGIPGDPPSTNQIRRRLGAWFRGQLREELGPIAPPVADLDVVLKTASAAAKRLSSRVPEQAIAIVRELAERAAKQAAENEPESVSNAISPVTA
jgi:hypothetical protein